MKKYIKHVGILVAGVLLAGSAHAIQLTPTDDARVLWSEATPSHADLNKGTDTFLRAGDGQNAERHNRAFLEFDLSGMSGLTITSAKLWLSIDTGHDPTAAINIHSVADDSWTEGTITWNNQPAHGAQVGTFGVVNETVVGIYVSADVTADVAAAHAGDGLWSAMLKDVNEQDFSGTGSFDLTQMAIFRSKEFSAGDFTPYLEISTEPVASTTNTISATDDARVLWSEATPSHADLNQGSDTALRAGDGQNAERHNRSFLEFDLSGISGLTILSAKLHLAIDAGHDPSAEINIHSVADDSWDEGALTWNNQPAHGAQVGTFGVINETVVGTYVTADVTADVAAAHAGDGLWSGMLKDANEQDFGGPGPFDLTQMAIFRSKESGSSSPYLEIITISEPLSMGLEGDCLPGIGLELTWDTSTGFTYMVESKTNLLDSAWGINQVEIIGVDGGVSVTTDVTQTQAFYRVLREPRFPKIDGYRGIWFTLGQFSTYGDKYSGGLGTYTAKHRPLAVYSPEANKTFFTYGGTPDASQRLLRIMVATYDHNTGLLSKPTLAFDKGSVNDPHDNGSLCLDDDGYVWLFVSGRGTGRPGQVLRSNQPYSTEAFEHLATFEFTYPQPMRIPDDRFILMFTKYSPSRELYWATSLTGMDWEAVPHQKLAGFGGHYQASTRDGNKIGTAFNRHPGGNVDARTDLYYVQSTDFGATWTTVDGTAIATPLTHSANPSLVYAYSGDDRLVYMKDLKFDANGYPVILVVTSAHHQPGPNGDPREWTVVRWNGSSWTQSVITTSTHNYDMGSLTIEPNGAWRVYGPTETGPQPWGTGGEIALWESSDQGTNWSKIRDITTGSTYNHAYVRHPVNASPEFYMFWADGNPDALSASQLFFCNREGTTVKRMPYTMTENTAPPEEYPATP